MLLLSLCGLGAQGDTQGGNFYQRGPAPPFPPLWRIRRRAQPAVFTALWSRRLGESTCRQSRHTSGWTPSNPPAERLSRAPESRGTHGELQSTKVSEATCVLEMFGCGVQCCKGFGDVAKAVKRTERGSEGQYVPVAFRSELTEC